MLDPLPDPVPCDDADFVILLCPWDADTILVVPQTPAAHAVDLSDRLRAANGTLDRDGTARVIAGAGFRYGVAALAPECREDLRREVGRNLAERN